MLRSDTKIEVNEKKYILLQVLPPSKKDVRVIRTGHVLALELFSLIEWDADRMFSATYIHKKKK